MVFQGFSESAFHFFRQLAEHNDKLWFDEHKGEYESLILEPSRAFVSEMGEKLQTLAPKVVADPRVNQSLFRLNRDTRFSKDKRPYKTHAGIWMWDGPRSRMENSGFYFHLEPQGVFFAVGIHCFMKEHLEVYRHDAVHPVYGAELAKAVKAVEKKGLDLGGSHYKRVPRGLPADHPNAALLLHNGLTASTSWMLPPEVHGPKLVSLALKHYKAMLPLHEWLRGMTERMGVETLTVL